MHQTHRSNNWFHQHSTNHRHRYHRLNCHQCRLRPGHQTRSHRMGTGLMYRQYHHCRHLDLTRHRYRLHRCQAGNYCCSMGRKLHLL